MAVLVLVLVLTALAVAEDRAPLKAGEKFPDVAGAKLEGTPPSLTGKVVLVDFWASWCVPCKASFPVMEQLYSRYRDQGFVILGVNVDEKRKDMDKFMAAQKVTFAVVRDSEQKLVAQVNPPAMPTSFLVDATGKVRYVHKGFYGDETRKQYLEEIESLLKEKSK